MKNRTNKTFDEIEALLSEYQNQKAIEPENLFSLFNFNWNDWGYTTARLYEHGLKSKRQARKSFQVWLESMNLKPQTFLVKLDAPDQESFFVYLKSLWPANVPLESFQADFARPDICSSWAKASNLTFGTKVFFLPVEKEIDQAKVGRDLLLVGGGFPAISPRTLQRIPNLNNFESLDERRGECASVLVQRILLHYPSLESDQRVQFEPLADILVPLYLLQLCGILLNQFSGEEEISNNHLGPLDIKTKESFGRTIKSFITWKMGQALERRI